MTETEKQSFLAVSREAVFKDEKSYYFFTVKKNLIKKIKIDENDFSDSDVFSVQSVELGDLVVIKPSNDLKSGEKVTVLEP